MKPKIYLTLALLAAVVLGIVTIKNGKKENEKTPLAEGRERESEENDELPAAYLEARAKYEFDMVKNPITGKIPKGIYAEEMALARSIPVRGSNLRTDNLNSYLPAGPNNIGGRTRAVAYDLRYNNAGPNKVIIAGCVSGGIMRSTDGGNTWTRVTPVDDVHAFTAIVQDPRSGSQDTWYAGGGEAFGNSAGDQVGAPYLGYGLWKSVNNGASWTKMSFTVDGVSNAGALEAFDQAFDYVHRLAVNPLNGDLYVACHRRILRTTNGGTSFETVKASATTTATNEVGQTDVMITNAGKIFVAFNGGNGDPSLKGIHVSNTGAPNSFTRIAGGSTLGVDSVAGWRANTRDTTSRRILMTLAPSDNNIAYVMYENGLSSDPPSLKPEADFYRLDISGNTYSWTNRSANMPDFPGGDLGGSDPLTVQGGYDMLVTVKPNDPNTVFIGGTNLYRSTDGFSTNANTAWINGYQTNFSYTQYPGGHPDIHNLVFNPSNPNQGICANDGGIQQTTDLTAATVSWAQLPNYQTLQYYFVAMDPDAGRNNFAGGAQDNGVHYRDKLNQIPPTGGLPTHTDADSNNHYRLVGGDGCAVGISRLTSGTQYLYGGAQYGTIQRVRVVPSVTAANIMPNPDSLTKAFPGATTEYGEFVTNFRVDQDNPEDLYYVNFNRLFRTTSASTVSTAVNATNWVELKGVSSALDPTNGRVLGIRAIAFTRGTYHTGHSLFLGTTNGKIYRLDDPRNATKSTVPVNITPTGLVGNVQDIAVNPNNDDEVMAVVSNYEVTSIWWTNNAKASKPTWKNAEGNLTSPSVRTCNIIVKKDASNVPVTEYYVGTSVGLYSTVDLAGTLTGNKTPAWVREGGSVLNYAVIQSTTYRPSDNVLLVGTHGNGMYYSFTGTANFIPTTVTAIQPVTNDRNFIRTVYPTITKANQVLFETGNMVGIRRITVKLMDVNGRIVYTRSANYQNGSLDLSSFASGNYILSIYSDDEKYRHVQKIIKQ